MVGHGRVVTHVVDAEVGRRVETRGRAEHPAGSGTGRVGARRPEPGGGVVQCSRQARGP